MDIIEHRILKLSVLDENDSKPELVGDAQIDLDPAFRAHPSEGFDKWHELTYRGKYAGEVYLEMTFYPAKPALPPKQKRKKKKQVSPNASVASMGSSTSGHALPALPAKVPFGESRPLPPNPLGLPEEPAVSAVPAMNASTSQHRSSLTGSMDALRQALPTAEDLDQSQYLRSSGSSAHSLPNVPYGSPGPQKGPQYQHYHRHSADHSLPPLPQEPRTGVAPLWRPPSVPPAGSPPYGDPAIQHARSTSPLRTNQAMPPRSNSVPAPEQPTPPPHRNLRASPSPSVTPAGGPPSGPGTPGGVRRKPVGGGSPYAPVFDADSFASPAAAHQAQTAKHQSDAQNRTPPMLLPGSYRRQPVSDEVLDERTYAPEPVLKENFVPKPPSHVDPGAAGYAGGGQWDITRSINDGYGDSIFKKVTGGEHSPPRLPPKIPVGMSRREYDVSQPIQEEDNDPYEYREYR